MWINVNIVYRFINADVVGDLDALLPVGWRAFLLLLAFFLISSGAGFARFLKATERKITFKNIYKYDLFLKLFSITLFVKNFKEHCRKNLTFLFLGKFRNVFLLQYGNIQTLLSHIFPPKKCELNNIMSFFKNITYNLYI